MDRKRKALTLFALGIALLLPVFAFAATEPPLSGSGLVPCGVSGTTLGDTITEQDFMVATQCQACNLVKLVQNIVNFLVALTLSIAVIMFAWAGILYFTSGAKPDNINRGKAIFGQTLLGFVIAISAWLIINTILFTILDPVKYPNSSWFKIDCTVTQRLRVADLNKIISGALGSVEDLPRAPIYLTQAPNGQITQSTCPPNYTFRPATPTVPAACVDVNGNTVPPITYTGTPTMTEATMRNRIQNTQQWAARLNTICAQEGLYECNLARAIMAVESDGYPTVCSGAGACGLMQLMPETARQMDYSNYFGTSATQSHIQQVLRDDPDFNMRLGVRYIIWLRNQGYTGENWVAGYNGGPAANAPSTRCPGMTAWKCTLNGGYLQTRNYVANVLAIYNLLNNPTATPGSGVFTYQPGIEQQISHASLALRNLFACMGPKLPAGVGVISSISDRKIVSGEKTFAYCAANGQPECAHNVNSCHYGGRYCIGQSYAVDFGDQQNKTILTQAANLCGASAVFDEGDHVHVSVAGSCGCN